MMKFCSATVSRILLLGFVFILNYKEGNAFSPSLRRQQQGTQFFYQRNQNLSVLNSSSKDKNTDDASSSALSIVYPPNTASQFDKYKKVHAFSIEKPSQFWGEEALDRLDWYTPFDTVLEGSLEEGDVRWFSGGKLNVCYNAIDRHVDAGRGNDVAMLWEGDEPDDIRSLTYNEVLGKVSQIANALRASGVKKGDVVTIYMPMVPELAMTMLACARIGAVHSVVFAGFSSEALGNRISAAQSKFVVTADVSIRGSKKIPLKDIVDDARSKLDCEEIIEKVFVWERFFNKNEDEEVTTYEPQPKDARMDTLVAAQRPYCVPETMDAEDNLFILYTSGSTGMPKGLVHTSGGYALYAAITTQTTFDLAPGDIFACVADCGWITGHTYVVYGPLLNGGTTFLFESTPLYPNAGRYWDMIQRHKITQFYTAPTAIRSLMRYGDKIPAKYDLSSLKVLGSVGEPINPAAWDWYYTHVGNEQCSIVDTYWQTETGGHIITNIPGVTPMKPGSCTLPFYGIDAVVLDPQTGEIREGNDVEGVLAVRQPWPGMARTCLGDHDRYKAVYLKPYPGYYFTGDSVYRDNDGWNFITGRVDDVLNVSGHRIGTAEVESALVAHPAVAQAAVVGQPHPIKGQSIACFVMLDVKTEESTELLRELRSTVKTNIGSFASPDIICVSPTLPMTRSGKIMRRILRKIVAGETDSLGDTSSLADQSIVDTLIEKIRVLQKKK